MTQFYFGDFYKQHKNETTKTVIFKNNFSSGTSGVNEFSQKSIQTMIGNMLLASEIYIYIYIYVESHTNYSTNCNRY